MTPLDEPSPFVRRKAGYTLSTERARIDVEAVHRFLSQQTYWARDLSLAQLERALVYSLPVGVYAPDGSLAGFGRVVTDCAMFAYLRDVFTLPAHRGRGLASWLATAIREHPELLSVTNWMLATRDAHAVYQKAGFRSAPHPDWYMSLPRPDDMS
jgi:GNAT superfamily N-acetyltransferase